MPSRNPREPDERGAFETIRDQILRGERVPRSPVGPARRLAAEMAIPLSEAAGVLDRLTAEGYLDRGPGSACLVSAGALFDAEAEPGTISPIVRTAPFRFDLIDFRPGVPNTSQFPVRTWKTICAEQWSSVSTLDLAYCQPEGRAELRREIALSLVSRGIRCQPDQIVITSGSSQALSLASLVLLRKARTTCLVEDPGSAVARRIFSGHGARIQGVPVDEGGMVTSALPRGARPAFIHVTPSHQFPTGGTMPIQRQIELLAFSRAHSTYIIEEDLDGDYRYDAPPISTLQGLSPGRVIHIGTFSMTVFPALRIGYIVSPPGLVAELRAVRQDSDTICPSFDQLVLAQFIRDGHYARHIAKMRKAYAASRELLVKALELHFGTEAQILGAASGLHLCARFPGIQFTSTLLNRIDLAGVGVYPVEEHAVTKGRWEDALILGFGMLDARKINTGMAILKRCLPAT